MGDLAVSCCVRVTALGGTEGRAGRSGFYGALQQCFECAVKGSLVTSRNNTGVSLC